MSKSRILVVDDELYIRLFLEESLNREGYEVVAVSSGREVVDLIETWNFDLVLLDLILPELDGMEVLAQLRQYCPDTVVILLTAHATLYTAVEALRLGASDYLFKPCKTIQLRESVRRCLLKREQDLNQRRLLNQIEQLIQANKENLQLSLPHNPIRSVSDILPEANIPTSTKPILHYGELLVDLSQHVITLQGQWLELSPTEFNLLAYLVSEAPRVLSPQELVREVHGWYTCEVWEARDIVRQNIYSIRQKIKATTGLTEIIRNVRGMGYTLTE